MPFPVWLVRRCSTRSFVPFQIKSIIPPSTHWCNWCLWIWCRHCLFLECKRMMKRTITIMTTSISKMLIKNSSRKEIYYYHHHHPQHHKKRRTRRVNDSVPWRNVWRVIGTMSPFFTYSLPWCMVLCLRWTEIKWRSFCSWLGSINVSWVWCRRIILLQLRPLWMHYMWFLVLHKQSELLHQIGVIIAMQIIIVMLTRVIVAKVKSGQQITAAVVAIKLLLLVI